MTTSSAYVYENCNAMKDVQLTLNGKRAVSKLYIPIEVINKKNDNEIIYENADSIQKYIQSQNKLSTNNVSFGQNKFVNGILKPPDLLPESPQNLYRSTLSLTIGRRDASLTESELDTLPLSNGYCSNTSDVSNGIDNESFKSSYAKSLSETYQSTKPKNFNSLNFVTKHHAKLDKSVPEALQPFYKESSLPAFLTSPIEKNIEDQDKFLKDLHEKVNSKQDELCKISRELLSLRMECNRLKAENKSLKVTQNVALRVSPSLSGGESQPSSLTSLSGDSDIWTLQQQITSLTSELERAELSRHAYESATRQLVHFLQTINSTLITISLPDGKLRTTSPSTPLIKTTEMLNQLENTIQSTNKHSTANQKRATTFKERISPSSDLNDSIVSQDSDKKHEFRVRIEGCSEPVVFRRRKPAKPKNRNENKSKLDLVKEAKKEESTRRFSLSHKFWSSPRKPMGRSGSVSVLSSEPCHSSPKVSRALSTQCIASSEKGVSLQEEASSPAAPVNNRLLSTKARVFFTSLKNIFKADGEKNSDASGTLRRKLTFPSLSKLNKTKCDESVLSNDQIEHDKPEDESHEHSFHSSVFYVSCKDADAETVSEPSVFIPDEDSCALDGTEISGPKELSVNLSLMDNVSGGCSKKDEVSSLTEEESCKL